MRDQHPDREEGSARQQHQAWEVLRSVSVVMLWDGLL